jgi:hypothetical protein
MNMMRYRKKIFIFLFLLLMTGLFVPRAWCALLWKDDFSDDLIFELTWDAKNSTGTTTLVNKRCIFNIDQNKGLKEEAIATLPSRNLPPNFDLHTTIEFMNVEGNEGEFFLNISGRMELVISFQSQSSSNADSKDTSGKHIFMLDPRTGKRLLQASGSAARFLHKITSGERCFVTWMSNGETPSLQTIKVGTAPGEANIADFIIESKEPVSGRVTIGIRKGLREARLNYVNAYLFGTSSTLVHDWVLF